MTASREAQKRMIVSALSVAAVDHHRQLPQSIVMIMKDVIVVLTDLVIVGDVGQGHVLTRANVVTPEAIATTPQPVIATETTTETTTETITETTVETLTKTLTETGRSEMALNMTIIAVKAPSLPMPRRSKTQCSSNRRHQKVT